MLARSTPHAEGATIRDVDPPITVLVVDDLASFRAATAKVIAVCEGFVCVGEADSGEQALAIIDRRPVDLVLMDVLMPGIGGIPAAEQIHRRYPSTRVILLSVLDEPDLPAPVAPGCQFCNKELFGPDVLESLWWHRDDRS